MSSSIILRGLAVAMMATFAPVLPAEPQSAAVDPQTLVGEWAGEFSGMKAGKGRYYLTIEKVDGDRVHLRIERPDLKDPAAPKKTRSVGTLNGNVLRYAASFVPPTQLTIDGDRMSGSTQGRELDHRFWSSPAG
jgi:hypothetical protein